MDLASGKLEKKKIVCACGIYERSGLACKADFVSMTIGGCVTTLSAHSFVISSVARNLEQTPRRFEAKLH
jgi:hypothetical protein